MNLSSLFALKPAVTSSHRRNQIIALMSCTGVALLLTSCTAPIGASRSTSRVVFEKLSASALNDRLSDTTLDIVHRYDLEAQFKRDPDATLKALHTKAGTDDRRDVLYALAELNYQRGARLQRSVKPGQPKLAPDYFLSSAIYAWLFLFGTGAEPPPSPFDERFRIASNIYNRAVARGFAAGPLTNSVVRPLSGPRALAPGPVAIHYEPPAAREELLGGEEFLPADEFLVRGLSVRNRQSGLGAPLIAVSRPLHAGSGSQRCVAATLLLRVTGDVQSWSRGELTTALELYYDTDASTVPIGDKMIPLEIDLTAPLAYRLNDSKVWELDLAQFFSSEQRIKTDLYATRPYQPGRIPVIFVHGTFSSPVWWAEMLNTLNADPQLRERFQFWYFIYNSGNPVAYSAANFRAAITAKVQQLDPARTDPALQQMVIVGHSQGGLLAKLTAVDTGQKLWQAISAKDFETLPIPAQEREALRRCIFLQPLPEVKRLVFISTPHQGSYRNSQFLQSFLRRFMTLPSDVVRGAGALMSVLEPPKGAEEFQWQVPTSLDGMSVGNKTVQALAAIPVVPGVKSHSIIAIRGDGPPEQGDDGVVKYSSAHVSYAESEYIVRSNHSCQSKPPTIEEVRRILFEHLASQKN
jgi:pimeloyl-ACP methyl ester carboxylesterase